MSINDAMGLINEYEKLDEAIKTLKKKQDEAKSKLIEYLDGDSSAVVGSRVIRNTEQVSNRFDTKRFKEDFGVESYAQYTRPVISFKFTIS